VTMTSDEHLGLGGIDRCPGCGSHELIAVANHERVTFACATCDQCWHVSMDWAQPVDPASCEACSFGGPCTAGSTGTDRHVDSTASV